ncbi:MAG TPA: hypothetical protein VFE63_20105 [Roseiarcus sp.]|jgi:hypothetical protein|nr:hypothetical protein [Roseiarcus sp.]
MLVKATIAMTLSASLAAGFSTPSTADTSMEVHMANSSAPTFVSRADAEAFLSHALPAATAANPKYHTPGADYDRRWLIKSITFPRAEGGGVVVSIDESFEDYRAGALVSRGTHQARFPIDDVTISPERAEDLSENGGKAEGVLFQCVGAACIHAVWDGKPSLSARTDIYVEDANLRDGILSAFRALQGKGPR